MKVPRSQLPPQVSFPSDECPFARDRTVARANHALMFLKRNAMLVVPAFASAILACGSPDRAYRGHTAPEWAAQLSAPSTAERVAAAEALYHIAPTSNEVVDALIAAMKDTSGEVQATVALALSTVGARAVPGLAGALDDDHTSVRMVALSLLRERGADAAPATHEIAHALVDPDEDVRIAAARTLERIGPAAREAEPALLEAARRGSTLLRAAALQALIANDAEPTALAPALAAALRDTAWMLRVATVPLLPGSRIGRSDVLAMIVPLTRDPDARVRQAAYGSIGGLLGSAPVDSQAHAILAVGTADPDPNVRRMAQRTLAPPPMADSLSEPRRR